MRIFTFLGTELIYRPIFNALILCLGIFQGYLGRALIALTLVVRLLLLKTSSASNNMQKQMGNLQPRMQEIQEKYKNDPQKMYEETMKVFKTDGMGPLKGCLGILIQAPVFIGLYRVIQNFAMNGIQQDMVYSFLSSLVVFAQPENLITTFGGADLLAANNRFLALMAGVLIYLQTQMMSINKPQVPQVAGANMPDMGQFMKMMNIVMVVMMVSIVYSTRAGIGLYLVITTLFSVIQFAIQYRQILALKFQTLWSVKKK